MLSEKEDDPGSSSDCRDDEKKKVRRRSNRKTKKIRLSEDYSSNDDSDQDWNAARKGKSSGKRKAKGDSMEEFNLKFMSGSFLMSKLDMQNFNEQNPPHIWRIDGKFLLQKFEPFFENNTLKYRNTSIYTGWSEMEKEKYTPLEGAKVLLNTNHKVVLTLNTKNLQAME